MLEPVRDWRRVATRAWSVRLMAMSAVLSALEAAAPYAIDDLLPSQRARALAIGAITLAALASRLVAQRNLSAANSEVHEHVDQDPV
jgi:hypothetical protein